jgi:signal transduction histidine kinase
MRNVAVYEEQRSRLDTLLNQFEHLNGKAQQRDSIFRTLDQAKYFAAEKLRTRQQLQQISTQRVDQWLEWLLILTGIMMSVAAYYSLRYLRQRMRVEGFNRSLLETTNNGIISLIPVRRSNVIRDYKITYGNDAAFQMLGIGRDRVNFLSELIPSELLKAVMNRFYDSLSNSKTISFEGYLETPVSRNWLQVTVSPLHEGLLCSLYDLNTVKRFEQTLTHKIAQLQMLNDELKQYAFVTSHDLQEPLRKIQVFSDMALNPRDEQDDVHVLLHKIRNSAGQMRELIQTLLEFTRSTGQPHELKQLDLRVLIQRIVADLEVMVLEKKAAIKIDVLPIIECSSVHLMLLFSNLITNALKYCKDDVEPVIEISAQPLTQADLAKFPMLDPLLQYISILIRDNGVGFKNEYADRIFTIFKRLHNKVDVHGAGIGLAICRKIVLLHHGHIYAEGVEGQGASIHVLLPLNQPPE